MKKSIVKTQWEEKKKGWKASLLLATREGFEHLQLSPGRKFSFEITGERRCTGYAPAPGERAKCPGFRKLEKGSQCPECRGKDIYSGYVRGDTQNDLDGEFSVYLAQISGEVKVGVTRSKNVPKRWVEQGADYAAEILEGLTSKVALENEDRISSNGLTERVRKEKKTSQASSPEKLRETMEEKELEGEIVDVNALTIYPNLEGDFRRKGLFEGELEAVKGQIVGNGRIALALTSGKVLDRPKQKGLNSF
ncbi:hypothetical protein AQV86_04265 [Nanohaloarchaea archaeon SG9]|nr:hypothetical protein AQV86_04265 [Nanohaloarchaea archaeon SG9]